MEFLPNEIIVCILSKVPIMELGGLKCVCKSWKKMIKDLQPALVQLQHRSPSISKSVDNLILIMQDDTDPRDMFCTYLVHCTTSGFGQKVLIWRNVMGSSSFEIVGSCNGLLCLSDRETRSRIVIMNPLTNQSMWLPNLDLNQRQQSVVSCGFGYNSNTNSYKVIVILETVEHNESEAIMFDCETNNSWRSVGKRQHSFLRDPMEFNLGSFLNGSLHWITDQEILSFDLINEQFTSIQAPGPLFLSGFCDLTIFKECFCVVRDFVYVMDIFAIKQHGVETTWENIGRSAMPFSPKRMCLKALGEVEDGKILLKRDETMFLYDPTSKELKSLEYQRLPKGSTCFVYFPTLEWPRC